MSIIADHIDIKLTAKNLIYLSFGYQRKAILWLLLKGLQNRLNEDLSGFFKDLIG